MSDDEFRRQEPDEAGAPLIQAKETSVNYAEPEPLSSGMIEEARKKIKEKHPISICKVGDVFPSLQKIGFNSVKKSARMERNDSVGRIVDEQIKTLDATDDPVEILGFGIVAFRGVMFTTFVLMVILSIFQLPALYIFNLGEGFNILLSQSQVAYIGQTLGNLGYSSVQCNQIPVGVGKLAIDCPYGQVGEIFAFGVNDINAGVSGDLCMNTAANEQCKPDNLFVK